MAAVHCPYCHEQVDEATFPAHEAGHRKARPDGQQGEYATLPPEQRQQGDLAGVPRVYVHHPCGAQMRMPEAIVRSYLANPHLYSDETFCGGCGRHVPNRECSWTETGENLQEYADKLRAARPELNPAKKPGAGAAPMGDGCLGGVLLALLAAGAALLSVS